MTIRDELQAIADEKRTYLKRRGEIVERARAEKVTWREIAGILELTEDAVQIAQSKYRAQEREKGSTVTRAAASTDQPGS